MNIEEIYIKANSVDGLGGMTVNERLHVSGLMELFDNSCKSNKGLAKVILQALKVDDKSIEIILGCNKSSNSTKTPWDFDNSVPELLSPNGKNKIEYLNLYEIAMGAPLTGKAYLINHKNEKTLINSSCGVPPIWNSTGDKFAIPIWTKKLSRGTVQKIGVVDIEKNEITAFRRTFNVIAFSGFDGNEIHGIDSPINKPKPFVFNTKNEKVDYKEQIKTIGNKL